MCFSNHRTLIHLHMQTAALPTGLTSCSPCITRRQANMTRSWPRTGGRMRRVLCSWSVASPAFTDLFDTHQATLEWPFISHSRRIPFTVLPRLSDELPGRLCLLSRPDLPTPGQCEQFRPHIAPDISPQTGADTHRDARGLVCEPGAESGLCRVRNLGARMGP
jgi:hypothetical protein